MSLSRQIREQAISNPLDKPPTEASIKTEFLRMMGLVGSTAKEGILSDLQQMLDRSLTKEIDGYVLAISRIVSHDVAWACIESAFKNKGKEIPAIYYAQFGKTQALADSIESR